MSGYKGTWNLQVATMGFVGSAETQESERGEVFVTVREAAGGVSLPTTTSPTLALPTGLPG